MDKKFIIMLIVTFMVVTSSAIAGDNIRTETGSEYLLQCKRLINGDNGRTLIEAGKAGYFFGMIDGITTSNIMYEYYYKNNMYCIPKSFNTDQGLRIIIKYLGNNPDRLHVPAGVVIHESMIAAFPCN